MFCWFTISLINLSFDARRLLVQAIGFSLVQNVYYWKGMNQNWSEKERKKTPSTRLSHWRENVYRPNQARPCCECYLYSHTTQDVLGTRDARVNERTSLSVIHFYNANDIYLNTSLRMFLESSHITVILRLFGLK